ncbi:hypothetical protein H6F86_20560 [Phormidium sp. FACHB-592]|uniref:Uncharacterized protein n=1 Tax=Stenomitos frigidus AS-A4 TaxID=2933935 RepID=A0ABV0KGW0_9CYAN|nr:hypothetical protein [Phormidium sp. FACHB-592]MBD2076225.1 hypothetical protein [Phormidium sp. FACHB-592]
MSTLDTTVAASTSGGKRHTTTRLLFKGSITTVFEISLTLNPQQLADLERTIAQLSNNSWIATALRGMIPELEQINRTQAGLVSQLPYSEGYEGRLKPSRKNTAIQGDGKFAQDTLGLVADTVSNWVIEGDNDTLANFSDRAYAGRQQAIAESKGVAGGFYADDETYFRLMELAIGDGAETIWRE